MDFRNKNILFKFLILLLVLFSLSCVSNYETNTLKVATYNIHYWKPVSHKKFESTAMKSFNENIQKSGSRLKYYAEEIARLDADIISLQEVPHPDQLKELASYLKMNYVYFPGGHKFKGWEYGIGGGILSKFKIVSSKNCPLVTYEKRPDKIFSRHFGKAVIDTGSEEIVVYSTHLLPSWKNTEHVRISELNEIKVVAEKDIKAGKSILLMGDFNLSPETEEYQAIHNSSFKDCFVLKGKGKGYTCSTENLTERIDYIWASGPLLKRLKSCNEISEKNFGVEAGSKGFALSDHLPVKAVFSK